MRLLLALLTVLASSMASAEETNTADKSPGLSVIIKRDISCGSIGVDKDKLKNWSVSRKEADPTNVEKKLSYGINKNEFVYSEVTFPLTIPEDSFIDIKAKATLIWKSRTNKTRQNLETRGIFYGADKKSVSIDFRHQEFYNVEKVEILSVTCNRFIADPNKAEQFCHDNFCPQPAAEAENTEATATPAETPTDIKAAPLADTPASAQMPKKKPKMPGTEEDIMMPSELPDKK